MDRFDGYPDGDRQERPRTVLEQYMECGYDPADVVDTNDKEENTNAPLAQR